MKVTSTECLLSVSMWYEIVQSDTLVFNANSKIIGY